MDRISLASGQQSHNQSVLTRLERLKATTGQPRKKRLE